MKDMQPTAEVMYRANAIRVLRKITDVSWDLLHGVPKDSLNCVVFDFSAAEGVSDPISHTNSSTPSLLSIIAQHDSRTGKIFEGGNCGQERKSVTDSFGLLVPFV